MSWFKTIWADWNAPINTMKYEGGAINCFTPRAIEAIQYAREEAARFNHHFVGTEHLLLGLVRLEEGVAVSVMRKAGINLEAVRTEIESQIGPGPDEQVSRFAPYTPRVKKAMALAAKEAKKLGHTYVGTEHMLLGLLLEGDGVAARVLNKLHVDPNGLRQEIIRALAPDGLQACAEPDDSIDLSKRYDIYCREENQEVVYKNASFKGVRTLFKANRLDVPGDFLEIEQADGRIIFVSRSSVVKFCEHRDDADRGGTKG